MGSIFSEIGKIIIDEADNASENTFEVPASSNNKESPFLTQKPQTSQSSASYGDFLSEQTPPPIEEDVVMDGEDILNVVVVNRIVPCVPQKDTICNSSEDDNLSFWESEEVSRPITKEEDGIMTEQISHADENMKSKKITSPPKQPLAQIEGDLTLPKGGTIFADIRGSITAKGVLHFCGTIDGNIEAEDIFLRGIINGSLKCRKLTMMPIDRTAMSRINGAISAESLFTEFS